MAKIINFGSLNIDEVYCVPHIVRPGETIAGSHRRLGCGGKGGNQSIALARAGAKVIHAGCIGHDGVMLLDNLHRNGVDTNFVRKVDVPSGHAIIQVDERGENAIIFSPGANFAITTEHVDEVIATAEPGDLLLLQSEINANALLIERGHAAGVTVALNFAPFDRAAAQQLPLRYVDLMFLNEREGADMTGVDEPDEIIRRLQQAYPAMLVVLTLGGEGACCGYRGEIFTSPSPQVEVIDTTSAGDTFIGYFMAAYMERQPLDFCLSFGCQAAALAVGRQGADSSIPHRAEVGRVKTGAN